MFVQDREERERRTWMRTSGAIVRFLFFSHLIYILNNEKRKQKKRNFSASVFIRNIDCLCFRGFSLLLSFFSAYAFRLCNQRSISWWVMMTTTSMTTWFDLELLVSCSCSSSLLLFLLVVRLMCLVFLSLSLSDL